MLRKSRIVLATVFFVGITLLFIGIGQQWWGWMAKLQFLPSCLALNFAVIAGIILLTLVFGRIYCSVICPMGVFQDSVNWLSSRRKGKKTRFKFHKENRAVRDLVLALTLLALMFGVQWFVALIAPYSAYGRIVRSFVGLAEGDWSGTLTTTLIVGGATLAVIFAFAWLWGREWCSSVCPVGTVLSLPGRFSMFRPMIDKDACVHCGVCGKKCKASCLNTYDQTIDYSRCIDCFDCIDNCKAGAIKYRFAWKKKAGKAAQPATESNSGTDTGRRAFMAGLAVLGASTVAKADGGFARIIDKQIPERQGRIVPAGAGSIKDFYSRCTACGLCMSACPNKVLRPSTDLEHLMQPTMSFEKGWCRPECTACSDVCPSGAILKILPEQKTLIKTGTAKINTDLCLSATGKETCGSCTQHCPNGAIRLAGEAGARIPVVNEELCIGCGACEYLCPVRPISAITVDGIEVHHIKGE